MTSSALKKGLDHFLNEGLEFRGRGASFSLLRTKFTRRKVKWFTEKALNNFKVYNLVHPQGKYKNRHEIFRSEIYDKEVQFSKT